MSTGATRSFHLPQDWTLRKVVTAMAQEWLPPFRAEPAFKAARWVVQAVMENNDKTDAPLWEAGISTAEYESRLERAVRRWAIRATAGRGKATILASFAIDKERPGTFQLIASDAPTPETLFDAEKQEQFLLAHGEVGKDAFFATLLTEHGFKPAE